MSNDFFHKITQIRQNVLVFVEQCIDSVEQKHLLTPAKIQKGYSKTTALLDELEATMKMTLEEMDRLKQENNSLRSKASNSGPSFTSYLFGNTQSSTQRSSIPNLSELSDDDDWMTPDIELSAETRELIQRLEIRIDELEVNLDVAREINKAMANDLDELAKMVPDMQQLFPSDKEPEEDESWGWGLW